METKRCWVFTALEKLTFDISIWKQLTAFVIIESERTLNGVTTTEHHFYITSCKKKSASGFIKATRDHWHIENKLHWVLDIAFREDESRLRKGDGAEHFSILRRIALNLLSALEYIVVHELTPLAHPNHTTEFWRAVEKVLPDYPQAKGWLRLYSAGLEL